jgi:hypothetical protein
MTCEKCGCATQIVEQSGGIKDGQFKEKYECVNGHIGFVRGKAEQPARSWKRTGAVFRGDGL